MNVQYYYCMQLWLLAYFPISSCRTNYADGVIRSEIAVIDFFFSFVWGLFCFILFVCVFVCFFNFLFNLCRSFSVQHCSATIPGLRWGVQTVSVQNNGHPVARGDLDLPKFLPDDQNQ